VLERNGGGERVHQTSFSLLSLLFRVACLWEVVGIGTKANPSGSGKISLSVHTDCISLRNVEIYHKTLLLKEEGVGIRYD
jgi:hypothetical protein